MMNKRKTSIWFVYSTMPIEGTCIDIEHLDDERVISVEATDPSVGFPKLKVWMASESAR